MHPFLFLILPVNQNSLADLPSEIYLLPLVLPFSRVCLASFRVPPLSITAHAIENVRNR